MSENEQTNGAERTLEEAVSEVHRELSVRLRCYDRWVGDGKLSLVDARDRIARLRAAEAFLNALAAIHGDKIKPDMLVTSTGDTEPA